MQRRNIFYTLHKLTGTIEPRYQCRLYLKGQDHSTTTSTNQVRLNDLYYFIRFINLLYNRFQKNHKTKINAFPETGRAREVIIVLVFVHIFIMKAHKAQFRSLKYYNINNFVWQRKVLTLSNRPSNVNRLRS